MILLIAKPTVKNAGGLWFVIPAHLQAKVVPYLQSKLDEVQSVPYRKHYRYNVLSKAAIRATREGYSTPLYMRAQGKGTFEVYMNWGEWRVGSESIASMNMASVQEEFLLALEAFEIPAK